MTPSERSEALDARLAAIREEAADMFATLPPGAVVVRAMQLLAMVDARDADLDWHKRELAGVRRKAEEYRDARDAEVERLREVERRLTQFLLAASMFVPPDATLSAKIQAYLEPAVDHGR